MDNITTRREARDNEVMCSALLMQVYDTVNDACQVATHYRGACPYLYEIMRAFANFKLIKREWIEAASYRRDYNLTCDGEPDQDSRCECFVKHGSHDWRWSSGMWNSGYECYNCGLSQDVGEDC